MPILQDLLPSDEHQKCYGYNFKPIPFPIKNNKEFQAKWLRRIHGYYDFPESLVPDYVEGLTCTKHGHEYSNCNDDLHQESPTLLLYSEMVERVFNTSVFSRPTIGQCNCRQQYDGTDILAWNVGQGRFIDFSILFSYLHKWHDSGLKIFAMWKSITNNAMFLGISCTLSYGDLHRSICCFMNNLEMDWKRAFSCPTHGSSPAWIVSYGKNLGSLKRRVSHLK